MSGSLLQVQREKFTHNSWKQIYSLKDKIFRTLHSFSDYYFYTLCQVCYLGSNNITWYNVTQEKSALPWGSLSECILNVTIHLYPYHLASDCSEGIKSLLSYKCINIGCKNLQNSGLKQERKTLHSEFHFTQGKFNLTDPPKSKKTEWSKGSTVSSET